MDIQQSEAEGHRQGVILLEQQKAHHKPSHKGGRWGIPVWGLQPLRQQAERPSQPGCSLWVTAGLSLRRVTRGFLWGIFVPFLFLFLLWGGVIYLSISQTLPPLGPPPSQVLPFTSAWVIRTQFSFAHGAIVRCHLQVPIPGDSSLILCKIDGRPREENVSWDTV